MGLVAKSSEKVEFRKVCFIEAANRDKYPPTVTRQKTRTDGMKKYFATTAVQKAVSALYNPYDQQEGMLYKFI